MDRKIKEIKDTLNGINGGFKFEKGKYYLSRLLTEAQWDYEHEYNFDSERMDQDISNGDYSTWWTAGSSRNGASFESEKRNYKNGVGIFPLEFDSYEEAKEYLNKVIEKIEEIYADWMGEENRGYSPFSESVEDNIGTNTISGNYEGYFFTIEDDNHQLIYGKELVVEDAINRIYYLNEGMTYDKENERHKIEEIEDSVSDRKVEDINKVVSEISEEMKNKSKEDEQTKEN